MAHFDFLIVGAGFSGAVCAEQIASQLGKSCLVIDQRSHIGGNAYDYYDAAGVLIHPYGPHYFRTNSQKVVDYLSQFTAWHEVEYKILTWTDGQFWQFPINLHTFEQLISRPSTPEEMEVALRQWKLPIAHPQNSEDLMLSKIGPLLYEKFFKNYTRKQWGRDPREIDANVCGRIPIRTNRDDRLLSERFQALPAKGYTALFERLLSHPNITTTLETSFEEAAQMTTWDHLIYTGPIDAYFGYRFGPLPYRSLRFEMETLDREYFQPVVQVNYPNDYDFTRIVEMKHATGQKLSKTTIVREYPLEYTLGLEPYYPMPTSHAHSCFAQYAELAKAQSHTTFLGRLANYRYFNMDHVIALALAKIAEWK